MISTAEMSKDGSLLICEASDLSPGIPPFKRLAHGYWGIDIVHDEKPKTFYIVREERKDNEVLWWELGPYNGEGPTIKVLND